MMFAIIIFFIAPFINIVGDTAEHLISVSENLNNLARDTQSSKKMERRKWIGIKR